PVDFGLGAMQTMDSGEVWFSVQTNFFSKSLGRTIGPGDLLSDRGTLVRSNAQLLARFNPANPTNDFALESTYVWPSGEIWFSTGSGFYSTNSNFYGPGDLLSDQGYVVYRHSDLVSAFFSLNNTNDFGLDSLFIVTDGTPASAPPILGAPQLVNQPPDSLSFRISGNGRAFQLERAASVEGPYLPVSSITPDNLIIDAGVLTNRDYGFYRVRQW